MTAKTICTAADCPKDSIGRPEFAPCQSCPWFMTVSTVEVEPWPGCIECSKRNKISAAIEAPEEPAEKWAGLWHTTAIDLRDTLEAVIAAYQELAAEKSKGEAEWEAINAEESKVLADMKARSPVPVSCPGADFYFSRAAWKRRPRRRVAISDALPTTLPDGIPDSPEGHPGASGEDSQGEDGLKVLVDGEWCEASDALKDTYASIKAALNPAEQEGEC